MSVRRQIQGSAEIACALERGDAVRRIVLRDDAEGPDIPALVERARRAGVPVQRLGARQFRRLRQRPDTSDALGLVGPPPGTSASEVLDGEGATWQLVGVAYPGNAGMALRSAEVSGAAGAFIDADFDRTQRRAALRASMRADRYLPVFFGGAAKTLDQAIRSGRRVVAVEDVGGHAPWDLDLRGRVHFVVGGEADGVPEDLLARCDAIARLPMAGILPCYNLQAAVAAVAAERLRQLEAAPA